MPDDIATTSTADAVEIVTFRVGQQAFCLEIAHVLEIRGWTETTTLPHAPDYVIGMMNLRGSVLPVIDFSRRLGLGPTELTSRHVIVIARIDNKSVGFVVDAVSDILSVHTEELQPTPDVASVKTQSFIKGVYLRDDMIIRAIDAPALLPQDEHVAA